MPVAFVEAWIKSKFPNATTGIRNSTHVPHKNKACLDAGVPWLHDVGVVFDLVPVSAGQGVVGPGDPAVVRIGVLQGRLVPLLLVDGHVGRAGRLKLEPDVGHIIGLSQVHCQIHWLAGNPSFVGGKTLVMIFSEREHILKLGQSWSM